MAALCPQCGAELGNDGSLDFGMATCPSCHAVVFIDIEGNAHVDGQNTSPQFESNQTPMSEPDVQFATEDVLNVDHHLSESISDVPDYQNLDSPIEQVAAEVGDQSVMETPLSDLQSTEEYQEMSMDSVADSGENVTQFANADDEKGSLNYTIIIAGIDTYELRQKIQEAISAPQFQWDVSKLMHSILDGRLEIKNVNAVKASRAIDALKNLPLQISWSQHVY